MVWNSASLTWERAAQAVGSAGGSIPDGIDITFPSPLMPSGGSGIRGWLSAIWTKLNSSLAVTGTFFQAVQPVQNAAGVANWGQALAVVAASTATVVNLPSSVAGYQIKGMLCHGSADGYFSIQVAGVTKVSGRIRSTAPMLQLILPNGISVTTGSAISVQVTNESGSTGDYEVTLLGT